MAELSELDEFQKNLQKLINERNNFVPNYNMPRTKLEDPSIGILKNIEEYGQPFVTEQMFKDPNRFQQDLNKLKDKRNEGIAQTYMVAAEHGQPYINKTLMVVAEHGRPYTTAELETFMSIREHGQPYKNNFFEDSDEEDIYGPMKVSNKQPHNIPKGYTPEELERFGKMGVPEHGQPYKPKIPLSERQTKMVSFEQGQPYKEKGIVDTITDACSSAINLLNPEYLRLKAEHDRKKLTCFDYCPNFAGRPCGKPGCHAYKGIYKGN